MRQNRFTFDYVSLVRTHINTQLILRIKYIFANNNSYEMPRLPTYNFSNNKRYFIQFCAVIVSLNFTII